MSTAAPPTSPPAPPTTATGVTPERLVGLRRWNVGLTVLHAVQAVAVLLLGTGFSVPVLGAFPEGPPGSVVPPAQELFDVPVAPAIAAFLGLAALDHLLAATVLRGRYEQRLREGVGPLRWVEYSFSATIMLLIVCLYSGITQLTALIAIAGANVAMVLFGWLQEIANPPGRTRTTMFPFWCGCLAGAAPWVAIVVDLVGSETVPGFVYGIFVSLFVFFVSFAVNQWLQFRGVGRWRDHAYGEKAYLVLSLAAKSALAWQVFGGSLAG